MNILFVTARLAYKNFMKKCSSYDILELPVEVASLIPKKLLKEHLSKIKKYAAVIVPGGVTYDLSSLERELNIPIRKGPIDFRDLDYVLSHLSIDELSPKVSADEVISIKKQKNARSLLKSAEETPLTEGIEIRSLKIGTNYPMRVMAEISSAEKYKTADLYSRIDYFRESGADIIDLGFSLEAEHKRALSIIDDVRNYYSGVLCIDTNSEQLLLEAEDHGADMLMSLNRSNYTISESLSLPSVVTPADANGDIPKDPKTRVDILLDLIDKIHTKAIADPILHPPLYNLVDSLVAYRLFRDKDKKTPLFLGVGNVTELIDADSIGINAIFSALGQELNVNILFTPEESRKCYQCVSELSKASKMMFVAKNTLPKDLGIDLLYMKEKRAKTMSKTYAKNVVAVSDVVDPTISKNMYFKLFIDGSLLCATFYENDVPKITLTSFDPKKIYKKAIELRLIDGLSHAAYLGAELQKAYIAIKTHRSYIQEEDLF